MESYSSGRRGVTRNLVGHEKLPPGFKSPTLRSKLHDSVSCSFICFSDDMTILFSGQKMLYRTKKKHRYNQGFWKWRYRHYNRIYKNIVIDCVKIWQPMTIFSLPKTARFGDIFCRRIVTLLSWNNRTRRLTSGLWGKLSAVMVVAHWILFPLP